MKRIALLFTTAMMLLMALSVPADAQGQVDSLSLNVLFRQDCTDIDISYMDNSERLSGFVDEVREIMRATGSRVQSITINAAASPEGSFWHNLDLSAGRAISTRDWLMDSLDLPVDVFELNATGENWSGLRACVEARDDVPSKDDILAILDRHSDFVYGRPASYEGSPKKELMDLNRGRTWFWLLDNIYPELRSSSNSIVCRFTKVAEEPVAEPVTEPDAEPVVEPVIEPVAEPAVEPVAEPEAEPAVEVPEPEEQVAPKVAPAEHVVDTVPGYVRVDTVIIHHHHYYHPDVDTVNVIPVKVVMAAPAKVRRERRDSCYRFAVETNLLFDAVASPTIGVEFPIGRNVSVRANHQFPWYVWDNDRYAYEILNTSAEVRLWLGDRSRRSVLTGGYVGLYGAGLKADIEYESKGQQVPYTWHAGVTGGWSLPVGKRDNFRLDFGANIGCLPISYDYYERSELSGLLIYQHSGKYMWIGPTDIHINLVWMLPRNRKAKDDNHNNGRRNGYEK